MPKFLNFVTILCLLGFSSMQNIAIPGIPSASSPDEIKAAFESWKTLYQKKYSSNEEESQRFLVFSENLSKVESSGLHLKKFNSLFDRTLAETKVIISGFIPKTTSRKVNLPVLTYAQFEALYKPRAQTSKARVLQNGIPNPNCPQPEPPIPAQVLKPLPVPLPTSVDHTSCINPAEPNLNDCTSITVFPVIDVLEAQINCPIYENSVKLLPSANLNLSPQEFLNCFQNTTTGLGDCVTYSQEDVFNYVRDFGMFSADVYPINSTLPISKKQQCLNLPFFIKFYEPLSIPLVSASSITPMATPHVTFGESITPATASARLLTSRTRTNFFKKIFMRRKRLTIRRHCKTKDYRKCRKHRFKHWCRTHRCDRCNPLKRRLTPCRRHRLKKICGKLFPCPPPPVCPEPVPCPLCPCPPVPEPTQPERPVYPQVDSIFQVPNTIDDLTQIQQFATRQVLTAEINVGAYFLGFGCANPNGVLKDNCCDNGDLNFPTTVSIVGYGTDNGVDYWLVKHFLPIDFFSGNRFLRIERGNVDQNSIRGCAGIRENVTGAIIRISNSMVQNV